MVDFNGSYVLDRNENLDEYFKEVGVPYVARKLVLKGSPSLVIVHDDGGNWQITLKEAMATNAIKFKLGEAFEDKFHGGKAYKSTGKLEDKKLVIRTTTDKGDIERSFQLENGELVMTLHNVRLNVSARRIFRK